MHQLPHADPGVADHRSPSRFLWWTVRRQLPTIVAAAAFACVWMVALALIPAVIGQAIDHGVSAKDGRALLLWTGVLALLGAVQAGSGVMRHRLAVTNWLIAAYRTVQLVGRHAAYVGATLPKRVATGEVVSVGATDLAHIGNAVDVIARAVAAVVSFVVVAVILLRASVTLGLVVLIGVPVLLVLVGPLLGPLQRRNLLHRDRMGQLTTLASDIVAGLRVLRGIGGEEVFHRRYVNESQEVRRLGVRVGRMQSVLDAMQILLPGIFIVSVVWLGARFAVDGRITPGDLVAFYGYSAFLLVPLRTVTEFANKYIRALVAAKRVCAILALEPERQDPEQPADDPGTGALVDVQSGLRVEPGRLTAVVGDDSAEVARLADRLGGYAAGDVRLAGLPLERMTRAAVRRHILVSDTDSQLFSGSMRHVLAAGRQAEDDLLHRAVHVASAEDVLDALPGGLDAELEERGRSLSGGQRQRMVLARALAANPPVLVLVEPTSAVDAHTEDRIAERLRGSRAGRTTVVMTASPLMLERADHVAFVREGRVVAEGRHRELVQTNEHYRRLVTRGEDM